MTVRHVAVHSGVYRDSVHLMQLSTALQALPGVSAALVAMATGLNLDLAAGLGFAPPDSAAPNDMLVAIAAADDDVLAAALSRLDADLHDAPPPAGGAVLATPRTVGAAVRGSRADLALISTPGRYAVLDALDALDAGCDVMLFSDNVPVEHEILLKDRAASAGRLVMGPDCGTAIVGGVGLGFANVVRPGPVGLVAASGTGAQQVMCLLDAAGVGISHCLGVGGRDLSAAVAGRSTLAALDLLDADEPTELIVLIGKPADPAVAATVNAYAERLATPVIFAILGKGPGLPGGGTGPADAGPADAGGDGRSGTPADLTSAVERVLGVLGRPVPERWPSWLPDDPPSPRPGALHGLFAGGTLRDEAAALLPAIGPPRGGGPGVPPEALAVLLDLGADEFTQGRAHPMIDGTLRLEHLAAATADPSCAAILLDVVLGHAADPDPAAGLAPAIRAARRRGIGVVVCLTGSSGDPQGRARQAESLRAAGAAVFLSNAEATRYAADLVKR